MTAERSSFVLISDGYLTYKKTSRSNPASARHLLGSHGQHKFGNRSRGSSLRSQNLISPFKVGRSAGLISRPPQRGYFHGT